MSSSAPPPPPKKVREWAPRIWEGCNLPAWLRLLARNRFAVQPPYWYIAAIVSAVSTCHTLIRFYQEAFYRHAIRRTPITHPPLFVLGHWRTGTTLLHELLILDPRHNFPNTYQCLEPNHFLLTEKIFSTAFRFLLPTRRPMDNMEAGWDKPQEDEFALCMLGLPSPYQHIAFPQNPPPPAEYLDLDGLPRRQRDRWKRAFYTYLQTLTYKDPRRLVLKSPPHTARIPTLLELFPDAKFVHIVRNPYVVFPSTVNLWQTFHRKHGLQRPDCPWLEEYVYSTFLRMFDKFEAGSKLIAPGRFHELKYEDLTRDPIGQMRALYETLNLGGFDAVRPKMDEYMNRKRDYTTNKYQLPPEKKAEVTRRWGDWIRRWGYEEPGA
jgi:hypothetical protein